MNRLNVDTLTPALLAGLTYKLMKGSCTSLTELEYHLEEIYKATTDQLDWVNPEGQQYPHNLLQPLPLIPDNRGRRVIPFDHFINNDLEYLWGGASSRKYTTSVTKTKAADYGHIKWIEDLVPLNRESALDVYSKRRIIAVTELKIVEWHNYKHLDWISGCHRYGSKGRRPALSISKMKAAYYPDAGLEQMVPDQFWIKEEYKYDIVAMYGISHWWFQRQRFYIDRHTSEGDRSTVKTHMRILSVVRIKVFSMYGYDYMKRIVLRRADLNEHVITERDFKYLYPSDFEDLNLLNLQGHLNHLPPKDKKILTTTVSQWTRQLVIRQRIEDFQLGIKTYQTQVNLTKPQWMATGFEYKHDYTIIESPRAVIFWDKYEVQMMMRFNEIHKLSDRTLQQIVEALDYRVKEFRINRMNPGLNIRFWTRKDVDRCNAFMFTIQRHLRKQRIFCNRKSFVGGRISVEVLRYEKKEKSKKLESVPTEMELILEHTQQGHKTTLVRDLLIDFQIKFSLSISGIVTHWFTLIVLSALRRSDNENMLSLVILILSTVRTHMRILSVVRIEVFSMYGYDYMKRIVLRRVDLNEHVITERDFKYLYPSDFEDLNLLNLQGHLNHLPPKDKKILTTAINQWTRQLVIRQRVKDFQLGIESYQTQVNLTKPQWMATGFEYKHDYTIIESTRAVIFRDKYRVQMMMRFNEIHKLSDGTLQQIVEALDYRVKEFRINRMNPGIPTVAAAGQKGRQFTTPCSLFKLIIDDSKKTYNIASATLMYVVMIKDR
nr:hypothetical protein [Tanacetum cinerariifolium]